MAFEGTSISKQVMVGILRAYLNRGDLLHDLQETVRQLAEAVGTEDTPGAECQDHHPRGWRETEAVQPSD